MLASLVMALSFLAPQQPAQVQPAAAQPWPPPGVYVLRTEKPLTAPKVIEELKPKYTADAMRARIQGNVVMEVIVRADGTVGEARVKTSLDKQFGLDEEAVKAVKQWRFEAGKKDGVAVPVLVEVEMTFKLRDK